VNVQPMVAPSVAENGARLRFFLSCAHTDEQVVTAVEATAEVLGALA
jgi:8-amino-7-oxononanoate synthase